MLQAILKAGWSGAAPATEAAPAAARGLQRPGLIFAIAMMTEPGLALALEASGAAAGHPAARLFWAPAYLALAPAFWAMRREIGGAMRATPLLAALVLLAAASAVWSLDPATTLRRVVGLAAATLLGWTLARLDARDMLDVCARAFAALAAASLALVVLAPNLAIMGGDTEHPGAWRGLWTHKNQLGGVMAVGAVLLLGSALAAPSGRAWRLAAAALAAGLVLGSTSKTALLVTLAGATIMGFAALLRRDPLIAVFAALGVLTLGVLGMFGLAVFPDAAFALLGRDATLTGRTDIWALALDAFAQRPLLGHGYGVFWEVDEGPAYWIRAAVRWDVPNAHNGLVELGLGLGLAGIALFVVHAGLTLGRGILALGRNDVSAAIPAILVMFAMLAASEGHILKDNSAIWALFAAASARLALPIVRT